MPCLHASGVDLDQGLARDRNGAPGLVVGEAAGYAEAAAENRCKEAAERKAEPMKPFASLYSHDFVRIAIVENEQRIRQAARNIGRFLKGADATLHNVIQMPKAG